MTGARLVHDTLEAEGWDVEIADAQKVTLEQSAGLRETTAEATCQAVGLWGPCSGAPTRVAA